MITIEIKITTESGDQVVNISQKCKESRIEEVFKSALAAYERTDDSGLGKFVFKDLGVTMPDTKPRTLAANFQSQSIDTLKGGPSTFDTIIALSNVSRFPSISKRLNAKMQRAMRGEFGKFWNDKSNYEQCQISTNYGSPHFKLVRVKGVDSPKVLFDSTNP